MKRSILAVRLRSPRTGAQVAIAVAVCRSYSCTAGGLPRAATGEPRMEAPRSGAKCNFQRNSLPGMRIDEARTRSSTGGVTRRGSNFLREPRSQSSSAQVLPIAYAGCTIVVSCRPEQGGHGIVVKADDADVAWYLQVGIGARLS